VDWAVNIYPRLRPAVWFAKEPVRRIDGAVSACGLKKLRGRIRVPPTPKIARLAWRKEVLQNIFEFLNRPRKIFAKFLKPIMSALAAKAEIVPLTRSTYPR
jgi:hypothetical protein